MPPTKLILIIGPTAVGKGSAAFHLAQTLNAHILSIDSMKVYRRMDIGTAKPSPDRRSALPYHLIDVVEPSQPFSVGRFVELADAVIDTCLAQNTPLVAVGGTAMYIRALIEGLFQGPPADPQIRRQLQQQAATQGHHALHHRLAQLDPLAAQRIHPNDLKRIIRALEVHTLTGQPLSSFHTHFRTGQYRHPWHIIGLRRPREDNNHRINLRVKRMVDTGLLDEVRALLAEHPPVSPQAAQAVGYAEIIDHLKGRTTLPDAIEQVKINTRRLAKTQRTWFRSFQHVHALDLTPDESPQTTAQRILDSLPPAP